MNNYMVYRPIDGDFARCDCWIVPDDRIDDAMMSMGSHGEPVYFTHISGVAAGILFSESLAGPEGARFQLWVYPEDRAKVQAAKRHLRNSYDVVGIKVIDSRPANTLLRQPAQEAGV